MQPKAVQVAGRSMRPVHHGATAEQDEPSPKVRRETLARGIQRGGARARRKRAENAILIGLPGLGTLLAIPYAFTVGVSTLDLVVLLCGYLFVGLGVSLGLHRHFSHRSFRAHWALRTALAIGGSMAFQGSILRWVSDHRRHHCVYRHLWRSSFTAYQRNRRASPRCARVLARPYRVDVRRYRY